jgi:hypothetical protein
MLESPGVDLRREDVSSVTHVSSLGFLSADGVPIHIMCRAEKKDRGTEDRRGRDSRYRFRFRSACDSKRTTDKKK